MRKTRAQLIEFLREMALIYRANETDEEIKQRVLVMGKEAQKSFLSKELQEFLISEGCGATDGYHRTKGDSF